MGPWLGANGIGMVLRRNGRDRPLGSPALWEAQMPHIQTCSRARDTWTDIKSPLPHGRSLKEAAGGKGLVRRSVLVGSPAGPQLPLSQALPAVFLHPLPQGAHYNQAQLAALPCPASPRSGVTPTSGA